MKKILKSLVCAIVSVAMVYSVGFAAACGGNDGDDSKSEQGAISYSGGALTAGEVSVNYTGTVATATGADGIKYTMNKGSLPGGITLSTDGTLSGKPTAEGDYTFTVKAASGSLSATAEFTLTINKHYYQITYSGSALTAATVNEEYSASVATATSTGSATISYALADGASLPEGLTLSEGGAITGTPTTETEEAHSFGVVASAEDAHSVTATFSIEVISAEMAVIEYTASPLEEARLGEEYSASVATATGAENITYSLYANSALPEGLTLAANGSISGTPAGDSDTYTFTVLASADGAASATAQFSLLVKPAQTLTSYTFEAEWVDLTDHTGSGLSGSADGTDVIQSTGVNMSNGYFVGFMHGAGISISFVINSDIEATAKLSLGLASEGTPLPVSSEIMIVTVNETEINYNLNVNTEGQNDKGKAIFAVYTISTEVNLVKGENVITLTTSDNDLYGGHAYGFMIDALYLETLAYLSWTPCNTSFTK